MQQTPQIRIQPPPVRLLPSAYEDHISQKIRHLNKQFASLTLSDPSSSSSSPSTSRTPSMPSNPPPPRAPAPSTMKELPPTPTRPTVCPHGAKISRSSCEPCIRHQHTAASKRAWDIAKDVYGPLHWRTSAARRDHTRARVAEQKCLDDFFKKAQAEDKASSSSSTAVTGGDAVKGKSRAKGNNGKSVSFVVAADAPPTGRPRRMFNRRSPEYVPGRYAGNWEDTSGMSVPFSLFYGAGNDTRKMVRTLAEALKRW
ncbi:hypothetical protein SLS58_009618 [Diplodia intermedia]|uniref:Uncharacterized protein n=1 Tax=Diplodia intermedia TaxID=856260 RepID=A0ABR3TC16_9PEZI